MAAAPVDAAAVEAEIGRIQTMIPDAVKALWRDTFKREIPKALTRDLLVRTLCWHIQEQSFGGHSPVMLKLLANYAKGGPGEVDRLRRLKPGTEIVREYQGERHTVVITREGFQWQGNHYPSLTAIARVITGTSWNGPRFFGLRVEAQDEGATPAGSPRPRGNGSAGRAGETNVGRRPGLSEGRARG
jgi:hypothetical protein